MMLTALHQQLLHKQQRQGQGQQQQGSYLFPLGQSGAPAPTVPPVADADADNADTADQHLATPARLPPAPPLLSPEYQSLLQELIAALLGYFGDVFVDTGRAAVGSDSSATAAAAFLPGVLVSLPSNGNGTSSTTLAPALWAYPTSAAASDPLALSRPPSEAARAVRVAEGAAPWLPPRDRAVLERLAALGAHCAALRAFVARERAADDAAADAEDKEEEEREECGRRRHHHRESDNGDANAPTTTTTTTTRSAYRRALASGVAELLAVYEATVTGEAQRRAVLPPERGGEGAGGGLPAIQHALAESAVLLPQLHAFVWGEVDGNGGGGGQNANEGDDQEMAEDEPTPRRPTPLRGAALLRALHRRAHCGHPLLEACFGRLHWHAEQALMAQLAAWVAHGELLERAGDGGGEFFVQAAARAGDAEDEAAADNDGGARPTTSAAFSRRRRRHDRPPTREEEEAASYRDWHEAVSAVGEGWGAAEEDGGGTGAAAANADAESGDPSSSSPFDLLPPGVTPQLAASAAFVGRAVRLLRSAPAARMARERQERRHQDADADANAAGNDDSGADDDEDAALPQLLPTRATRAYAEAVASVAARASPAGGTALLPAASSSSSSSSSSSLSAALARAVELARADAARRLWRVLARDADVLGHLRAVRAYALLGRGDLFSAFLEDFFARAAAVPISGFGHGGVGGGIRRAGASSSSSSHIPVPAALEAEVRRAWLSAAARCGAAADPRFGLFWPRLVASASSGGGGGHGAAADPLLFSPALAGPRAAEAARRAAAGLHPPPLSSVGTSDDHDPSTTDSTRHWGDALCLSFRPPWPLGLLLTPAHLARYSALGRALLRLRRVQAALDEAWADLGRLSSEAARAHAARRLDAWRQGGSGGGANGTHAPSSSSLPPDDDPLSLQLRALATCARLRQHMAHLVANLAVYLQTDVVDGRFAELLSRVARAADFAEAQAAHDRCVRELVTQSLLPHASLSRQFGEVFSQALRLAELVSPRGVASAAAAARGGVGSAAATKTWVDAEAVRAVSDAFQATTAGLYVALQSRTLQQHDRAPHLRQLQLRLDFNGFIGKRRLALLAGAKEARAAAQQQMMRQQQQQQQSWH